MLFLNNKYTNVYYSIIDRAKNRVTVGYTESHHIIPKSLGGLDESNNLVSLTAREHYLCHLLLPKMLEGENKYKMLSAILRMAHSSQHQRVKIPSRIYEKVKKEKSLLHTELFSGENNHFYNKKHSQKTIDKIKAARAKQAPKSKEAREKLSKAAKGRILNNDHKAKISAAHQGKTKKKHNKIICPYCGKLGGEGALKRWHFDRCKSKVE